MIGAVPLLQAQEIRPVEYIESSSPLPGGGVVTSVHYPGHISVASSTGMPVSWQETSGTVHSVLQTPGQTVLMPPATIAPGTTVYSQPAVTIQQPTVVQTVPAVPTLGVPVPVNRVLRAPYAIPATTVYSPAHLAGVQPPAATLAPTLVSGTAPSVLTGQAPATVVPTTVYSPLVRLQNMPASAYPGQGILGSPKLYVDGQPVRNLLRYLIIP